MAIEKGKTGFTLIETVVAFAIIAIIVVVAMMGFNTIAGVDKMAKDTARADESLELMIAAGTGYTTNPPPEEVVLLVTVEGIEEPVRIPGRILAYEEDGRILEVFRPDPAEG